MNSKSFIKNIFIILCITMFASSVYASAVPEKEATQWVNAKGQKLISTLSSSDIEEKYKILDSMFHEDIDTEYMARFVIGKYWKLMDEDQKTQYIDLFKRYAISLYKNYPLNIDTEGLDFSVLSVKQNQKLTDVACSVTLPKKYATEKIQDVSVKFKLTQENKKIKIVDLILGQSSLLQTYRSRFYKMIEDLDNEISWFLEDFTDMVISSEKTAQEKADY